MGKSESNGKEEYSKPKFKPGFEVILIKHIHKFQRISGYKYKGIIIKSERRFTKTSKYITSFMQYSIKLTHKSLEPDIWISIEPSDGDIFKYKFGFPENSIEHIFDFESVISNLEKLEERLK